ncbi:MAG: hypothetical protein SO009_03960 [Bacilli bacterium]|nr:hypothetical protein [Bacilli bacterium]
MNIQGTSKVIAITKDQAQKMKSAYTNQIDAMSLPTEPIAPVTVAPTVEPLTMEEPAMSGVTNADIIGQTPSAPVAPETQPLNTPEAPIVSQDTTQSLAGYPDTSAMSVDELKDEMAKIEQEMATKNIKIMDFLDEINADFLYHQQLVAELDKKMGLTKAPNETAPIVQNVAPAATATPVVQETSQEISPFSPGTTGNMFDVPTSGMSL